MFFTQQINRSLAAILKMYPCYLGSEQSRVSTSLHRFYQHSRDVS